MKVHHKAVWAGLIVWVTVGVGCHHREQHFDTGPQGRTLVIHIRSDAQTPPGQCSIDCKTVSVYTPDGQKLRWVSDDKHKYTVDFEMGPGYPNPAPGTPFKDAGGKPKHTVSTDEPEIEPTGPHGYFYYAVKDENGNTCLRPEDPGLHVNP